MTDLRSEKLELIYHFDFVLLSICFVYTFYLVCYNLFLYVYSKKTGLIEALKCLHVSTEMIFS